MKSLKRFLFGFNTTCIIVGSLDILFSSSMFVKGVMNSMAKFNVPEILLSSPHYNDAMSWVFLHMFMIGNLLIMIGVLAENPIKKLWVARGLVVMHCVYAFLDLKTSDNYFGNALYQGSASVIPVYINLFYILLFLRLSFAKTNNKPLHLSPA